MQLKLVCGQKVVQTRSFWPEPKFAGRRLTQRTLFINVFTLHCVPSLLSKEGGQKGRPCNFLPELISAKSNLTIAHPKGFQLLPRRQLPRSKQGRNTDDRVAVFWPSGGTRVWTERFVLVRHFGPSRSLLFRLAEDFRSDSSWRYVTQMSHCFGLGGKPFDLSQMSCGCLNYLGLIHQLTGLPADKRRLILFIKGAAIISCPFPVSLYA